MPAPAPLRLKYSAGALRDLENLVDFIAQDRPRAAERTLSEIKRACEGLCWFPIIGRQLDPDDERVRVLTLRRRVAVKYVITPQVVHILGVTYRGRDLDAFFASRRP